MSTMTRVMIIEDDLKIAELHRRYLEKMGDLRWSGLPLLARKLKCS